MDYHKPIEDILSDTISSMSFPVSIYKIAFAGNTYTLNVDDVYHAQVGEQNIVTIGGNPYTITSVAYGDRECDNSFDVLTVEDTQGSGAISVDSFNMYAPFFIYGTLTETGTELPTDNSQCTPMIFLRLDETLDETFHEDPADPHERDTACELAFLTQGVYEEKTQQLLDGGVTPMRRLMANFFEALKAEVKTYETYDFNPKAKYYTKVYVRDSKKQLWSNKLSGVWDRVTLKILK